jgi:uncharacterized protein YuzE
MKVTYDVETDSLSIVLRDAKICESDEISPSVIADFDDAGEIVRFEILSASRVVQGVDHMDFERIAS